MVQRHLFEISGAFRHFFDHHPHGLWVVNLDGRILDANAAALAMLGYTIDELLQTSTVQLLNRSDTKCSGTDMFSNDSTELAIPHKQGHFVYVRVTVTPLVGAEQELPRLITLEDITQQREQFEYLLKIQEMFAFISEKSQNIISAFSPEGVFTYISPTVMSLLGYTPEEVIGMPASAFNHPETNEELLRLHKSLSSDRETERFTGRLRHKNGDYRWYETTVQYIRDSSGAIVQTIGVGRDITHRKEAEQRIAYLAYHDTLTDLPNRRMFKQYVSPVLERSTHEFHSLMLLDLDEFKHVNDTLGHEFGDLLLVEVAKRLTHVVENTSLVARWGGDEFIVFRENSGSNGEWDRIIRQIHHVISKPIFIAGHTLSVNISVGVALFPMDGQSVEALMRHADAAMYSAKHSKARRRSSLK